MKIRYASMYGNGLATTAAIVQLQSAYWQALHDYHDARKRGDKVTWPMWQHTATFAPLGGHTITARFRRLKLVCWVTVGRDGKPDMSGFCRTFKLAEQACRRYARGATLAYAVACEASLVVPKARKPH
jgi:hypothetical protein